jgi:dihydrofolate synthase/folylpolyglutamate synthase
MEKSNNTRYQQAVDYLYSRINLEKDTSAVNRNEYKLDVMRFLLARFGNPQVGFKVIHIAGSKAKGSTATLIASVLTAAGRNTGLYTSPHVSSILERIAINGRPMDREAFTDLCLSMKNEIEGIPPSSFPDPGEPSFFELMTLLAWLAFRQSRCEYVVLETGMGGRLDATNLTAPAAVALTPIELEHQAVLGDTLEKIAAEKCGIIKQGVPVFCSRQPETVKRVIREQASAKNAPVVFFDEVVTKLEVLERVDKTDFRFALTGVEEQHFTLGLAGRFQAENATLAFMILRRLEPGLPGEAYRKGFASAFLPARMEVVCRTPLVIVDGAHTPGSVSRALESFTRLGGERGILLFAAVRGKKIDEMAVALAPHFLHIIVSTPGFFRRSEPNLVYKTFCRYGDNVQLEPDPQKALNRALALSAGVRPVLAVGSLYFAAELRAQYIKGVS